MSFLGSVVADAHRGRVSQQESPAILADNKHGVLSQAEGSALLSPQTVFSGVDKRDSLPSGVDERFIGGNHASQPFVNETASLQSVSGHQSIDDSASQEGINQKLVSSEGDSQRVSDNCQVEPMPIHQLQEGISGYNEPEELFVRTASGIDNTTFDLINGDDGASTAIISEGVAGESPALELLGKDMPVVQPLMKDKSEIDGFDSNERPSASSRADDLYKQVHQGKAKESEHEMKNKPSALTYAFQEIGGETKQNSITIDSRSNNLPSIEKTQNSDFNQAIRPTASSVNTDNKINAFPQDSSIQKIDQTEYTQVGGNVETVEAPALTHSVPSRSIGQSGAISDAVKSANTRKSVKPSFAEPIQQTSKQSLDKAVNSTLSRHSSRKTPETFAGPKVQIGLIDVTIELQQPRSDTRSAPTQASGSIASRHYLRGL